MNFSMHGAITPADLNRIMCEGRRAREACGGLKREGWTDIVRRLAHRLIGGR